VGLAALALAAVALGLVWRLMPPVSPPVYDGCITGPYLSLGSSPAPEATQQPYPAGNNFQPSELITGESPAQAQILMMLGTFDSTAPFTVSITPVRPPRPAPPGEQFDGNVYRIVAATASGRLLQPQAQAPVTIVLRATASSGPTRAIVRLDGTTWTPLQSAMAGCGDEYEAASSKLGIFAIVMPGGSGPAQPGGFPAALVIAIIAVVLVGAAAALIYVNRPRATRRR
jgi:hypothetical protein